MTTMKKDEHPEGLIPYILPVRSGTSSVAAEIFHVNSAGRHIFSHNIRRTILEVSFHPSARYRTSSIAAEIFDVSLRERLISTISECPIIYYKCMNIINSFLILYCFIILCPLCQVCCQSKWIQAPIKDLATQTDYQFLKYPILKKCKGSDSLLFYYTLPTPPSPSLIKMDSSPNRRLGDTDWLPVPQKHYLEEMQRQWL